MNIEAFALPAVFLVSLTSLLLLNSRSWRWSIFILAVQYIGVFVLVAVQWPIEMALSKVVAGWMAGAVLGIAASEAIVAKPDSWRENEKAWPSGWIFRLLAASLVVLIVLSLAPKAAEIIPGIGLPQAWGSLILIGMGLLELGLTTQPMRVVIGLLTILSGFEILYAAVESSALVAGLLAAANMALALIGAYLLVAPGMEGSE